LESRTVKYVQNVLVRDCKLAAQYLLYFSTYLEVRALYITEARESQCRHELEIKIINLDYDLQTRP
jgi:hypothetical protein